MSVRHREGSLTKQMMIQCYGRDLDVESMNLEDEVTGHYLYEWLATLGSLFGLPALIHVLWDWPSVLGQSLCETVPGPFIALVFASG